MKKKLLVVLSVILCIIVLTGCKKNDSKIITICASEIPHAQILEEAVKPLLEEKGFTLKVTILDWTIQNEEVYTGDYDANYFEHIPYLLTYSGNENEEKVFAVCKVHYEPLSVYADKASHDLFDKDATISICNDVSNATRALNLLVESHVIDDFVKDSDGNAILESLPSNIYAIQENLLVSTLDDYDYSVLPCNTAMTGGIDRESAKNKDLPTESATLSDNKANVLAASTSRYKNDEDYRNKIDILADILLSDAVKNYINDTWKGVVLPYQKDLRNS